MGEFRYEIVKNPEIFMENRLPAHSDHRFFRGEVSEGESDARFLLNGSWKFAYAENYGKAITGFYAEDFDVSGWDEIPVPGHIQMHGYDRPAYVNTQYPWDGVDGIEPGEIPTHYNPTASYVRFFEVPEWMKGKRIILSFQGVESGFALWINGSYVGYSEDSFTPSEFDVTALLKEGSNRLAVQVFKWTAGSWCEDQDFYRFSGIFRDVFLYAEPEVHVRDLRIQTLLDDAYTDAELELNLAVTGDCRVLFRLYDGDRTVLEEEREIRDENSGFSFSIKNPRKWSAEDPYLYRLILEVYRPDGERTETVAEKVGFRRFELIDHVMHLNGKRIVFKGVNRHEFDCRSGRVVPEEVTRRDILTMKRNNINAVRTCHYPNSTHLYRLCDEYGLYLIDETNLETHGVWDAIEKGINPLSYAVPGDRPEYREMVLDRARSMFERDKNHPSILIWSCGNESYGGSILYEESMLFRGLDQTRLVQYEGIFHDRRYNGTSDVESTMYIPVDQIREFLAEHRDKPYICCEYSHAMGNSCGAMHKYTDLAEEEPLYQGGFIWDFVDQCVELTDRFGNMYYGYGGDCGERPTDFTFSGNGIVYGSSREPSPKMQEVKFNYRNIRISFGRDSFTVRNRNLFTNTNAYDCIVTLAKDGEMLEEQAVTVSVEPLSEGVVPLPFRIPDGAGEYALTVSFRLKEALAWAPKGHEVAFGQLVTGHPGPVRTAVPKPEIIRGWHNVGARGRDFEVLFSILHGGLVSYRYRGREMVKTAPKPNFWRAMTDNDIANLLPMRAGQWRNAGMYCTVKEGHGYAATPCTVEETDHSLVVTYTYHLCTQPKKDCIVRYEVFGDGEISVRMRMDETMEVGELPEFSMLFTMDADYDRLKWYGLGPEETYMDRCHAKLGIYRNRVPDNMAAYLRPQECGNKMGVRTASVTDRNGRGLRFTSDGLQFSALPYTPHQIDTAEHSNELPPALSTIVRIGLQMGIGGDDTWGALVHREYLLDNSKPMEIEFSFRGL